MVIIGYNTNSAKLKGGECMEFSEKEKAILFYMFDNVQDIINLNEYIVINGEVFNSNDLYDLGEKIGLY